MSFTASILVYIAGVILSALIFGLLRKRTHVAVAEGAAMMILLLSLYPLVRWMSESQRQSFMKYALLSLTGALVSAVILFIMQKRA
ncbi:MAG TPA: hypothetical protein VK619_03810 [Pyrinomonadaceae bacterium]|nr:hypothetical protein [Pyrinomonadaceae bacterium]